MKGWVYVASMSNTVGVLKIGHSTRSPETRVQEWARDTGAPGTARVEFAVLVENAFTVEQIAHARLSHCRDHGEWFKCDVPDAIKAILQTTADILDIDCREQAWAEVTRRIFDERKQARRKLAATD